MYSQTMEMKKAAYVFIKKITVLLLAASMCISFCACSLNTKAVRNENTETIIFVDDAGREVEVPADISRIIPSGILAQLVLLAIAPDMFVGLASEWDPTSEGIISDKYLNLKYYGQFYGKADMNIEELSKADPDIVIDVGESKEHNVEDMDAFTAKTGIPIVFIKADMQNMDAAYEKLGKLLKREEKAKELSDYCHSRYDRAVNIMEQVGDNKAKTLYLQGDVGLNVMAAGSYHSEVLDLLCDNAAVVDNPSGRGLGNEVSIEQIVLWDPDFIIFGPRSIYGYVEDMPVWKEMDAVKDKKFVEAPDVPYCWMGSPVSVQRYLALVWIPKLIYPQYCDYDLKEEVKEYYRLFYGCSLTDEQYEEITKNAFFK